MAGLWPSDAVGKPFVAVALRVDVVGEVARRLPEKPVQTQTVGGRGRAGQRPGYAVSLSLQTQGSSVGLRTGRCPGAGHGGTGCVHPHQLCWAGVRADVGPDFRGHTQCPRGLVRDRHCPRWGPGLEVQRWETTMSSLWCLHGGHLSPEWGPWGHPTGAGLILSPGPRLVLLLLPFLGTPGEHVGSERQPWPGVGFPGTPPAPPGATVSPPTCQPCALHGWPCGNMSTHTPKTRLTGCTSTRVCIHSCGRSVRQEGKPQEWAARGTGRGSLESQTRGALACWELGSHRAKVAGQGADQMPRGRGRGREDRGERSLRPHGLLQESQLEAWMAGFRACPGAPCSLGGPRNSEPGDTCLLLEARGLQA